MSIATEILTDEQARRVRDNEPTLSDRPPGVDLPTLLNDWASSVSGEVADFVSGTATVLDGNTSVTVTAATLGGTYGGSPVQLTWAEQPTAATDVSASWSGDDLVITIDADNTADVDVYFLVDGRS